MGGWGVWVGVWVCVGVGGGGGGGGGAAAQGGAGDKGGNGGPLTRCLQEVGLHRRGGGLAPPRAGHYPPCPSSTHTPVPSAPLTRTLKVLGIPAQAVLVQPGAQHSLLLLASCCRVLFFSLASCLCCLRLLLCACICCCCRWCCCCSCAIGVVVPPLAVSSWLADCQP